MWHLNINLDTERPSTLGRYLVYREEINALCDSIR